MLKQKKLELYLHIPFCVRKCAYCDFLSFSCSEKETGGMGEGSRALVPDAYMKKLLEEIDEMGKQCKNYEVSTIFVGGGTPSILESGWIVEVFSHIQRGFRLAPDAEISIEANPGTVSLKKLSDYRKAGINRLSLGLQSADDRELRLLGRIHTFEEFLESFHFGREAGFENINVDLMSALPGQTAESWTRTLTEAAALAPEHISAYSLILEEGTPFYETYRAGAGKDLLPDEEEEREMYHQTKRILKDFGYDRYEISNYAKRGRECRHNLGYWTGIPYVGLGLGASSDFEGKRYSNTASMEEYLAGDPGQPLEEAGGIRRQVQDMTKKDRQEEFFFLGLRLVKGVSLKEFAEKFGVSAKTVYPGLLERFVREKAAEFHGDRFRLTEFGLDVSNYVMAEFLQD